jgi:tetratricopeptide (TPR) repeat protein
LTVESLELLGATLLDEGDPAEAELALYEAQRRYPGDVWLNLTLAMCLQRLARREEAIRYYTAARSLQPQTAHDLAHALFAKGETNQAIAVFQDLVRLRPKEIRHLVCLGQALNERGRTREAKGVLDAAIAVSREGVGIKPDSSSAHYDLGYALEHGGELEAALAEYRQAVRLRLDTPLVHLNLASTLRKQGRLADAIAEVRQALQLKPDFYFSHNGLGVCLAEQGKLEDAMAEFREAVRLQPDFGDAHNNLGAVLRRLGRLDDAIVELRHALRLNPYHALTHQYLGTALYEQKKLEQAIAELREAVRLKPDSADAHHNLGAVLKDQGKLEEAIAEHREALRLNPDFAEAHFGLGLCVQGKFEEALAEYRTAIRLKPDYAEAHCNLAAVLQQEGHFVEALAEFKRGHELGLKNPRWPYPSARWVQKAERVLELDQKLPTILSGLARPADAAETIGFAQLCYGKKLHGASARLWAEAFEAEPKLARDIQAKLRYNAACAASLAGCGQGKDDPPLDEATKARWRKQAIDWLKADLAAWSKLVASSPPQARRSVVETLQHWKADTDLAGIRDEAAIKALPDDEQKACQALWVEVDALLANARAGKASRPHR